ncbi:hypothetical protein BL254_11700 [Protofrankia sp. BMG5.30]|uniref:Phosphoglycerate kinase n=1 Tax=Protofrankia coriariae TaxID=1562887 RepID=A0ABR5F5N2_9ACTN|nr:hypothetical protein FrCorBMG51_07210 [Protofrankia coriariae]ONH35335.1 hypothetical protein BL254_11700 [Protofrankia sp. BMG5.30]
MLARQSAWIGPPSVLNRPAWHPAGAGRGRAGWRVSGPVRPRRARCRVPERLGPGRQRVGKVVGVAAGSSWTAAGGG